MAAKPRSCHCAPTQDTDLLVPDDPVLQRGAYLVDHLGQCGERHKPNVFTPHIAMGDRPVFAGEHCSYISVWLE